MTLMKGWSRARTACRVADGAGGLVDGAGGRRCPGGADRALPGLSDGRRQVAEHRQGYAYDLKDYWTFLAHRGLDWREVRLEDLGEYVVWLQLPPSGRKGRIAVLPSVQPHVSASTVNRKLSALSAFYAHQLRHGVDVGDLLTTLQPPGRRGG
ncbi:site-specific integrase [Streptomyces sp. NPDC058200]|uniref:site-specific integrase n=1 Tax=Streptomyces sp. NPDC058200 TaxID=3346378 RepID=UPI0036E58C8C